MNIDDMLNATPRSTQPTPNPQEDANMFTDILAAPFRGVEGAVQSLYDLADFATGDDLLPDYDSRFLGRSKTFAGGMVEGVSQFMTGFIPVAGQLSKVGKLSTAAKGLKGARGARKLNLKGNMAAGAVADFSMFQAQEDRLSNLIETFPSLSNPVSEYLASDEDDGELEGRLKNTLEGLALGGVVDGLIAGVKAIKKSRRGDDPKAILEEYENVVFSGQRDNKLLQEDFDSTETFRASLSQAMGRDVTTTGESTSAFDLLQGYAQSYDGDLAPLFKSLLSNAPESLKNTMVTFGDGGGSTFIAFNKSLSDNATGQAAGSITMGKGGVRTLAHELMHATTLHKLNLDVAHKADTPAAFKEMMTEVAAQSDNATSGLARTYLKAIEKLGLDEKVFGEGGIAGSSEVTGAATRTTDTPYAFTNLAEFISEAFSNEEFRMVLSAMESDVPKKSVFDELLAAVKGMLGLSATDGSLLDDVFKYTGDIVSDQNRMFDEQFSFLKDIDQLHGQTHRTLDDRGGDFTEALDEEGLTVRNEKGETLNADGEVIQRLSEMQEDDLLSTKPRSRVDWKLDFGSKNWRGKKVSEVPSEYLTKALEWDSVKPHTKEKIEIELKDRKANGEELYDFNKERKTKYSTAQKQEAQEKIKRLKEYQQLDVTLNNPKKGMKAILESYKKQLENTPSSDLPNPKNPEDISPDKRQKLEAKIIEVEKNIAVGEKKMANVKKAMGDTSVEELLAENEFILNSKSNTEKAAQEKAIATENTIVKSENNPLKDTVINPTLQESYRNYRRNKAGGRANPRVESFKEYVSNRGLDKTTPTSKDKKVPNQFRDEGIKNPYNTEMGQAGFVSNVVTAKDKLFSDSKYTNKHGEVSLSQLKNLLIKNGPKGTQEELDFLGFDDYFTDIGPKDKIRKEGVDNFLAHIYNHEFIEVTAADLDFESARFAKYADGEKIEADGYWREKAEKDRQDRISQFNTFIQGGESSNVRAFILRDVGTNMEQTMKWTPSTQTLNEKLGSQAGSHYGTDVVYHIRTSDRVNPETGGKVLYIEEIQSDLLSSFKKWKSKQKAGKTGLIIQPSHIAEYRKTLDEQGEEAASDFLDDLVAQGYTPDLDAMKVPFNSGYENNAARQAIKMAAEKGYDEVWLPSGDMVQQNLGNEKTNFGFYDTTHKKALRAAAKNLDSKFQEASIIKRDEADIKIEKEEFDDLDAYYEATYADVDMAPSFEDFRSGKLRRKGHPFYDGIGIKISDEMRAKAPQPVPVFGQAQTLKEVEEEVASAITRLARQLNTGGDQAIMSAARNISSSRAAVGVISAIAENLKSKGVKGEQVTAEELAAETKDMVDLLGGNQNTWAGAVAKLKRAGGSSLADFRTQQRAAKTLIDLMSRDLVDLAKEASAARKDSSKNLAELEAKVVSGIDQLTEVQRIWSLMGKEAGLSLVQRKFLDGSKGGYRLNKDVGFDFIARDPEDYAKYSTETTGTMDVQDVINKLVMAGSDSDVARAIGGTEAANARMKAVGALTKEMQGGKMMNMVTEYWMNSLLSGPATQVVNTLGSALTTSLRMGEMAFGGLLRGEPDVARAVLGYAFKMETIHEAFKMGAKAWRTQDPVLTKGSVAFNDTAKRTDAITSENASQMMGDNGKRFDVNKHDSIAKAVDAIGKGVRLPSRGLMTVDEFFKQLNYRSYVRTNLAYEGLQSGKKNGKELAEFVNERFQNYITKGGRAYNESNVYLDAVETSKTLHGLEYGGDQMSVIQAQLAQNPYDPSRGGLADAALEFSKVNTFTNDLDQDSVVGILGDTLGKLKTKIPMLNFVVPFINTPTNILKFALDRTPLGMGADLTYRRKKLTEGLNSEDPMVRAQTTGRLATGASVVAAGVWYTLSNKEFITGGGPRTQEEKEALQLTGWQPYSFVVGNKYVSYQRLDPMATVIGLFADLVEAEEYYDLDDTAMGNMFSAAMLSFSNNVTNKSYVKGLDNMLNMLRDPAANSKALAGNIAGGFVPTLFSQGQNYSDERVLRETRTVFDYMLKKSPASGVLPKKRNFLGEAVKYENLPMGAGIFNPVYFSTESGDEVNQELGSLAHGFNKQNSKIGGSLQTKDIYNEEGRQAYDVWLEKTGTTKIGGKTLRQSLARLIKSKEYQALPKDSDSSIGEKSPRIRAVNNWLRRFRKQGRREMMEEFPELQQSMSQLTQEKQQYRLIQ